MGRNLQFKHVNGRNGKVESICMYCLLAVGICSSDEDLLVQESRHRCNRDAEQITPRKPQIPSRSKLMRVWTWNKFVAILPRRRLPHYCSSGAPDE